jgi:hypothetical protein
MGSNGWVAEVFVVLVHRTGANGRCLTEIRCPMQRTGKPFCFHQQQLRAPHNHQKYVICILT